MRDNGPRRLGTNGRRRDGRWRLADRRRRIDGLPRLCGRWRVRLHAGPRRQGAREYLGDEDQQHSACEGVTGR